MIFDTRISNPEIFFSIGMTACTSPTLGSAETQPMLLAASRMGSNAALTNIVLPRLRDMSHVDEQQTYTH
jgi:hypothetical protein